MYEEEDWYNQNFVNQENLYLHLLEITVQRNEGTLLAEKKIIFKYTSQRDKDCSVNSDNSFTMKKNGKIIEPCQREMDKINKNIPLLMKWKFCFWKSISIENAIAKGFNVNDILTPNPFYANKKTQVDRSSVNSIIQGIARDIENKIK
jgi:hypothetical protein